MGEEMVDNYVIFAISLSTLRGIFMRIKIALRLVKNHLVNNVWPRLA